MAMPYSNDDSQHTVYCILNYIPDTLVLTIKQCSFVPNFAQRKNMENF